MSIIKEYINNVFYGNSITLIFRLFGGLLFIYSGFFKTLDLDNFGRIIMMYDIIPQIFIPYCAIIISFLEIILGILLLIGFRIRAASFVTILLMLLFIVLIGINVVRGKNFDCGCFELNYFGIKEEIGIPLMIRDVIIIAIVAIVFYAKKHLFSLDSRIEKDDLGQL